jgi:hypothetical protein
MQVCFETAIAPERRANLKLLILSFLFADNTFNDPQESPYYWLAERTWLGSHSVAAIPVFISCSPLSKNGHA